MTRATNTGRMQTLQSPQVAALLDELFADAARADQPLFERLRALPEAERAAIMGDYRQMYAAAKDAYLPISRPSAVLLYSLARARQARTIVEFGTSFGISTIYLAAAVRDQGAGRVITSEFQASKVERARHNFVRAGLADLIELRAGDALETLAAPPAAIDLVYLDGAKALYRRVLGLLEPALAPNAVIVADNIDMGEHLADYTAYIREPRNGYASTRVVVDGDALEVTVKIA